MTLCLLQHFLFFCSVCSSRSLRYLSALSITVGLVAHENNIMEQSLDFHKKELWTPIADENELSPFTRVDPGINNILKPEDVHDGGNMILRESGGNIKENMSGKLPLLSNLPMERLFTYDVGSSFSAPMVTNILGKIANKYPNGSANLLKNLLLQSTRLPEIKNVKGTNTDKKKFHFNSLGYGLPNYEYAIASFDNRVVLLDEATIGLNKIQVYSVDVPKLFFEAKGHKRVPVALTFNPPTRMTRGDSYLGNQLEFKLFHTLDSDIIVNKFAEVDLSDEEQLANVIDKKYEIVMDPGIDTRKKGCYQKGVKEYKREPQNIPTSSFTLVIINSNKWINDLNYTQDYCVSMVIEHIEEIKLYNKIRNTIQSRVRIR